MIIMKRLSFCLRKSSRYTPIDTMKLNNTRNYCDSVYKLEQTYRDPIREGITEGTVLLFPHLILLIGKSGKACTLYYQ